MITLIRVFRSLLYVISIFITYNAIAADIPVVTPVSPASGECVAVARPAFSFTTAMSGGTSVLDESVELIVDAIKVPVERDNDGVWNASLTWDLTEGDHWASVVLIGLNGNTGGLRWSFYADFSSPTIQITSHYNQQAITGPNLTVQGNFGGLTSQQNSTLTVRVDTGTPVTAERSWSDNAGTFQANLTGVAAGWHWVEATLRSPGGKTASAGVSLHVYIAPTQVVVNSVNGFLNSPIITGMINGSDPESWLSDLFLHTSNNIPYWNGYYGWTSGGTDYEMHFTLSTGSGQSFSATPNGTIPDGVYTLTATYTNSDNIVLNSSQQIMLDTQGPEFSPILPAGSDSLLASTATLSIADPLNYWGGEQSGVDPSSLELFEYDGNSQQQSVEHEFVDGTLSILNPSNGVHTYHISVADFAGNTSYYQWVVPVTRDMPTISEFLPGTSDWLYNPDPVLSASYTAYNGANINTQSLSITIVDAEGTHFTPTIDAGESSFTAALDVDNLPAEGVMTVVITVADTFGNVSEQSIHSVKVDRTPPDVKFVTPFANAVVTVPDPYFTGTLIDTGSGLDMDKVLVFADYAPQMVVNYETSIVAAQFQSYGHGSDHVIDFRGELPSDQPLDDGSHVWGVWVFDKAGNYSYIAGNFTMDCTQPYLNGEAADLFAIDFPDYTTMVVKATSGGSEITSYCDVSFTYAGTTTSGPTLNIPFEDQEGDINLNYSVQYPPTGLPYKNSILNAAIELYSNGLNIPHVPQGQYSGPDGPQTPEDIELTTLIQTLKFMRKLWIFYAANGPTGNAEAIDKKFKELLHEAARRGTFFKGTYHMSNDEYEEYLMTKAIQKSIADAEAKAAANNPPPPPPPDPPINWDRILRGFKLFFRGTGTIIPMPPGWQNPNGAQKDVIGPPNNPLEEHPFGRRTIELIPEIDD